MTNSDIIYTIQSEVEEITNSLSPLLLDRIKSEYQKIIDKETLSEYFIKQFTLKSEQILKLDNKISEKKSRGESIRSLSIKRYFKFKELEHFRSKIYIYNI
jgi:hypothetical protein